jgi:hypothetical protein
MRCRVVPVHVVNGILVAQLKRKYHSFIDSCFATTTHTRSRTHNRACAYLLGQATQGHAMLRKRTRRSTNIDESIKMEISVRKQGQALGVRFWDTPEGEVMLVHKHDHGIFASCSSTRATLKVGMTIRRINGVQCQSAADVTRLLEQAPLGKVIRIEAGVPNFRTTALATQQHPRASQNDRQHLSTPKEDLHDDLTCTDVSESDDERDDDDDDVWCSDSSFTAQDSIFFLL